MARTDDLLLTTVKLNIVDTKNRIKHGTSFFFSFTLKDRKLVALISNKHVLYQAHIANCEMSLETTTDNVQTVSWTMFLSNKNIITHPDSNIDLALIPISGAMSEQFKAGFSYDYRCFDIDTLPTQEELKEISVMQNIVMIGYPNGKIDSINNTPLCRHGITATPPARKFNGERAFLVDVGCAPGSSGSPIVAYDSIWRELPDGRLYKVDQARLIGIFCSGDTSIIKGETVPTNGGKCQPVNAFVPYGIGKAISSQCLDDFVPLLEKLCK